VYIDPTLLAQLDERIRTDLESVRDCFFNLLLWATGIVLVGVLLEGPEIVHELYSRVFISPGSSAFSATVHPTVRIEGGGIRNVLSFLGWFILIIGLCGEGAFEGLVNKADGMLQTSNNILVSSAETQAAGAQEEAGAATERAASADLKAAELLNEIQPRTLSKKQSADLGRRLQSLAGIQINFLSYPGDAEALRLGLQLQSIFTAAHVNVAGMFGRALGSADAVTIGIQIYAPAADAERRRVLTSALHDAAGLAMAPTQPVSGPGTQIAILVGVKPLPKSVE